MRRAAQQSDNLPRHYWRGGEHGEKYGDGAWIRSRLALLPYRERLGVAQQYSDCYKKAGAAETCRARQTNAARYAANCWLRERTEPLYKPTVIDDNCYHNNEVADFCQGSGRGVKRLDLADFGLGEAA